MLSAPTLKNEKARLSAVMRLGLLNTEPEERFDDITKAAVKRFDVPISTITIMDKDREWFKSCQGTAARQGPREISFCGHAMLSEHIFIVRDTLQDERFVDNPYVTGKPFIRFYAGVSLREHQTHHVVGVFCVKDTKPRDFTSADIADFLELAKRAEDEINNPG